MESGERSASAVSMDAGDPSGREWVLHKQDDKGRWALANSLNGKVWADVERKGKPRKWVTLHVLCVLRRAGLYEPGDH